LLYNRAAGSGGYYDKNWNLGIGSASKSFHICESATTAASARFIINEGGAIVIPNLAGSLGAYVMADSQGLLYRGSASDEIVKTDMSSVPYGLDAVSQLNVVSFKWATDYTDSSGTVINYRERLGAQTNWGLVAQQVLPIIPELVSRNPDTGGMLAGLLTVDYDKLVPVLINALKEEKAKREALETRLAAIEEILKNNNLI
jgi:hypothetical protein